MAYLTLDADVKDDFVQDLPALQAMFELAKASVALAHGLGEELPGPGSQGLARSLGNRTPLSSSWLCPLPPVGTRVSRSPPSRPHFT